ncbi:DUF5682 family protein [Streptomyces sp. NPDC089799]|uniref:DUF5682 family protein n=1 Tax=Streptomyces sp. NPDC089799 TaxID=3155066 RepID=UPI00343EA33E
MDLLGASREPFLLGVRHHSPALAAVTPALLDASGADVVCVELPADFQDWLPHLADPETTAPVALAAAGADGRLAFYPFADFSPELAAIRWAREHEVEVLCCDLPLGDPGWSPAEAPECPAPATPAPDVPARTADVPAVGAAAGRSFAEALASAGTGRDGEDLWDRAVEVLAPGCPPEAVRRAALGVGWALRRDAEGRDGVPSTDLAREAHMRRVIHGAASSGRTVAAVVGAFHAPVLTAHVPADAPLTDPSATAPAETEPAVTSLVAYSSDLLDSRSGYPAGIRDPLWQQAVLGAGGDPERVREAAALAVTGVCRELRGAGHTAGTGEAAETLRLAGDLARLRGLPAPGRGELLEAVTTVLGQGEPLGRGRALARALDTVLVGAVRGRLSPRTPRSGLGPDVERELAALRLPGPGEPAAREVRLDPLRSPLDARREVLLQRLLVCGASYGEPLRVAGTGDGTALGTRWRVSWTPAVPARLDLAGVRGVTVAQAAAGTLRETARREAAEGGPTCGAILTGLGAAARCDLPGLVAVRLAEAAEVLPGSASLPELLSALDLLDSLRRGQLPGAGAEGRAVAAALAAELLQAAVRTLPGLAGSDDPADAAALAALADRAAAHHLGLRLDRALAALGESGSPLMQGAALAVRVLLDLERTADLGGRAAGWIDAAGDPDGRRRLTRRLTGLLAAAAPLLQVSAAALDPLLDRIEALGDREFLDRLPALRGGFDALSPAGRDRMLAAVSGRLGDRIDLSLAAPPALLALWAAADAAGAAAVKVLREAAPGGPGSAGPGAEAGPGAVTESVPGALSGADSGMAQAEVRGAEVGAGQDGPAGVGAGDPSGGGTSAGSAVAGARRIGPADRWRLLLGREHDRLPSGVRRHARALDELYGAGRGEGSSDLDRGGAAGPGGGQDPSFPTAREWAEELAALFGTEVREEVLAAAADAGRTDVLERLDPAAVRPSVELLTSVLSLAGGMPEHRLARLRPLVRRLVEELTRELATRTRPALTGLATPRPTRRPGGRLDLARTLRANLAHARRLEDGRVRVVPERPVFSTRVHREADWRLILVVDVSGSMEASVIWSALTAAVLAGVPTLSTHFLAFSTGVVDLTERVDDPLSLLLEVRVGGGTHIAAALAHARSLITVPSRTLVVVVSDFEEGMPVGGLLGEVRALAGSGAHLLGCAALDDTGTPRYSVPIARQVVAAGMPVAALSPLALARWVGDRLRGDAR